MIINVTGTFHTIMLRIAKQFEQHKLYERFIRPLLLALGIFYFTFHAVSGEHGIYTLLKEQRRLELLNGELDTITAQRKELEHRVKLMSSDSLDLDLLDEQSRRLLGDSRPDELVIPSADPKTLPGRSPHE